MNFGNLVFLVVALGLTLLFWQRTVSKRRWLPLLLIVLPIAFFSYRWAIYREQLLEWKLAAGGAVVLNVLFWLVYGRTHPPGHKGEIVVAGMEDAE